MRSLFASLAFGAGLVLAACATVVERPDPYLWLEEVEGDQALAWAKTQSDKTFSRLTGDPRFEAFHAAALSILTAKDRLPPLQMIHARFVYDFWQDEANVRGLWRRATIESVAAGAPVWETVLDLDAQAQSDGFNWVWKGAVCQPNGGARCMVGVSLGGKDATIWAEFDLVDKAFVAGGFVVPEGKSTLAWRDADTLMVARDWGMGATTPSGYPFIVKLWARGTELDAATELYRGQATDTGVFLRAFEAEDGTRLITAERRPTFFTTDFVDLSGPAPASLPLPPKAELEGLHKDQLIVTLQQDWSPSVSAPSGALVSLTRGADPATAGAVKVIAAPGPKDTIREVAITRDAVLVSALRDVKSRVLRFGYDGVTWVESQVPMPGGGTISIQAASTSEPTAFAVFQDFTRPATLYSVNARTGSARKAIALPAQFDASGVSAEQREATSTDGTKIPYFLVRKAGAEGPAPTLLYGYGGFQLSQTPTYNAVLGKLWLERGGVYVVANIRGGGEFGPAWHQAGLKTKRQIIYDDFIAVAEDLIASGVTNPDKLGIMGGSNGGLLMGVMLTQRPDLFNAALIRAPLLDMLRYHELLAGASWIDEYGDPRIPAERDWLSRFSPYQNLVPASAGRAEPFFITSTKDDRVHPGHARKLAAKMEAAGAPFLYYENMDGGHSTTANQNEIARKNAMEFAYLSQRLMD